jgi:hypothetical protein
MEAQDVDTYVLDITNMDGIPFRVVYGVREYAGGARSSYPLVSFYDRRYPGDRIPHFTENGQFISDYTLDYLLERTPGYGLCLNWDVFDWNIDATTMFVVMAWLKQMAFQLAF